MSALGESQTVKKTMKPSKIDLNTLPISEMLSSIYQKKIRQVKIFLKKTVYNVLPRELVIKIFVQIV